MCNGRIHTNRRKVGGGYQIVVVVVVVVGIGNTGNGCIGGGSCIVDDGDGGDCSFGYLSREGLDILFSILKAQCSYFSRA